MDNREKNKDIERNKLDEKSTKVRRKSNNKAKFIALFVAIVILAAGAWYIKTQILDKTAEGFPKLDLMEQDFSPDGNAILRLYGELGNATDNFYSRFEVEQNGKKNTIWYEEGINPLSIKYEWSDDSQSININGTIIDKNTTLTKEK